jgi:hypothetical protein
MYQEKIRLEETIMREVKDKKSVENRLSTYQKLDAPSSKPPNSTLLAAPIKDA